MGKLDSWFELGQDCKECGIEISSNLDSATGEYIVMFSSGAQFSATNQRNAIIEARLYILGYKAALEVNND